MNRVIDFWSTTPVCFSLITNPKIRTETEKQFQVSVLHHIQSQVQNKIIFFPAKFSILNCFSRYNRVFAKQLLRISWASVPKIRTFLTLNIPWIEHFFSKNWSRIFQKKWACTSYYIMLTSSLLVRLGQNDRCLCHSNRRLTIKFFQICCGNAYKEPPVNKSWLSRLDQDVHLYEVSLQSKTHYSCNSTVRCKHKYPVNERPKFLEPVMITDNEDWTQPSLKSLIKAHWDVSNKLPLVRLDPNYWCLIYCRRSAAFAQMCITGC